jgi:hypothetical protein
MTAPPCDSVFADRTIFVLGTRRSGTTWLSELLMAHPDIGGPGTLEDAEGNFLPMESLIFGGLADLWVNTRADRDGVGVFMDRAAVVAALRTFCDRVFEAAREKYSPGAPWYLDKSPDNVDRIPILAETHPDAWNIHIVRDGRDVVRSLLAAPFEDITTVGEAAARWARNVGNVIREKGRLHRLREVTYEQLLVDPVGETTRLFEWLGLAVNDEIVERVRGRVGRPVARMGSTGAPRPGRWREMDPDDLATVYELAGDVLAECGYLDGSGPLT